MFSKLSPLLVLAAASPLVANVAAIVQHGLSHEQLALVRQRLIEGAHARYVQSPPPLLHPFSGHSFSAPVQRILRAHSDNSNLTLFLLHSWELGTAAVAFLELDAADISVYGTSPFPPPRQLNTSSPVITIAEGYVVSLVSCFGDADSDVLIIRFWSNAKTILFGLFF